MLVGKKPFMAWGIEDLRRKMEEFKSEKQSLSSKTLPSKKARWKKAMKK